ncbi:hypothetical protein [Pectobacterium odoriferum]|uniref:hypothetical protein n=1 Tax=Pectobacterium odoriferum TaxID=78398 RepID=UPI001FCB46D6|nr:hypothetical protein [Pectobacterium odoriferum]
MINRIEGGSRWGSTASSAAQHNTEASRPGGQQDVSPAMRSGSHSIDFGDASPNLPQVSTERTTTAPTRIFPAVPNVAGRSLIAEPKPPVDLQAISSIFPNRANAPA